MTVLDPDVFEAETGVKIYKNYQLTSKIPKQMFNSGKLSQMTPPSRLLKVRRLPQSHAIKWDRLPDIEEFRY